MCYAQYAHVLRGGIHNIITPSSLSYTTFKHIPWCHAQHSHIFLPVIFNIQTYRGVMLNILTFSSLSYRTFSHLFWRHTQHSLLSYTTFKHIPWCHAQYYHALRGFIYTQIRCRSSVLSPTCMSSASIIISLILLHFTVLPTFLSCQYVLWLWGCWKVLFPTSELYLL